MRPVILHELLELMSLSPFWESLVLFATTWNIWRDSDHTRRRRSRIMTCCHFITRNTPSSEQERRRQCGANQSSLSLYCRNCPSFCRSHVSFVIFLSLFSAHFTLDLSLPVLSEGKYGHLQQPCPLTSGHAHTHTDTRSAENFMGYRVDSGQRREN